MSIAHITVEFDEKDGEFKIIIAGDKGKALDIAHHIVKTFSAHQPGYIGREDFVIT